jgi:hypothetical protein
VADEEQEPNPNPKMLCAEQLTKGPVGVRTRFKAVHASRRRPAQMIIELTECHQPTGFYDPVRWGEIHSTLVFEPDGARTRIRWNWDVRPRGIARFLSPLITIVRQRSERACWKRLRRYLETTAAVL